MGDLCMCGHEEREHDERHRWVDDLYTWVETCSHVDDDGPCMCAHYRRSPLSAFRGPAVSFTREEAAGWLKAFGLTCSATDVLFLAEVDLRCAARTLTRRARRSLFEARSGLMRPRAYEIDAARCYLAARILRAVRP